MFGLVLTGAFLFSLYLAPSYIYSHEGRFII
jgi:hypothetical protein